MNNLRHTFEVQTKINQIKKNFNLKDENLLIVDYCLGCQKQFKVYRNEIQDATSINLYVDKVTSERYLYSLCSKCVTTYINPYNKKAFKELDDNICKEIAKFHPEILAT